MSIMKKSIIILSILAIIISSCRNETKVLNYDFTATFEEPEEIAVGQAFTVTLSVVNKDKQNKDDMKMKISFPPNVSVSRGSQQMETNHIYDISYSEMENVKLTFEQTVIRDDTVKFNFANSYYNKDVKYVVSAKNYKGTVTIRQSSGGEASQGGGYHYGQEVELKATPDEGYLFKGWFDESKLDDNGELISTLVSNENPYKFKFTGSIWLTPKFEISKYLLTLTAGKGGKTQGGGSFNYGVMAEIRAIADEHYTFTAWYENGEKYSDQSAQQVKMTRNITLEARFKPNTYMVNVAAGAGGQATGGGWYDYGSTALLKATPDETHKFDGWFENGKELSVAVTFNYEVKKPNNIVEARFSSKIYTINHAVYPSGVGTVTSNSPTNKYTDGDNVHLTVKSSNEHYVFDGWHEGTDYSKANLLSNNNPYDFIAKKNMTISARYEGKMYKIYHSGNIPNELEPIPAHRSDIQYGKEVYVRLKGIDSSDIGKLSWTVHDGESSKSGTGDAFTFTVKGDATVRWKWIPSLPQ